MGGRQFDVLVTAVSEYFAPNSYSNGINGRGTFGQINIGYGSRVKLRFSFVAPDTMYEVQLPQFSWSVYDIPKTKVWDFPQCREMLMVDTADQPFSYVVDPDPKLQLRENGTQTWFISEQETQEQDNPKSPSLLTKSQQQRSVELRFVKQSHIQLELAFQKPIYSSSPFTIDGTPCFKSDGGRNFIFEGSVASMCSPSPPMIPPPSASPLPPSPMPAPAPPMPAPPPKVCPCTTKEERATFREQKSIYEGQLELLRAHAPVELGISSEEHMRRTAQSIEVLSDPCLIKATMHRQLLQTPTSC